MGNEKKDGRVSDFLQMQAELHAKHPEWSDYAPNQARDYLLYAVEEMGEVIAIMKKKGDADIMAHPAVRAHLVEELADTFMYLYEFMHCYGITAEEFTESYEAKFNRNMSRSWDENKTMYTG